MARRRAIGFFITPAPKGRWPGMSKTGQGALRKTQAIKNPRSHGESGFFTRPGTTWDKFLVPTARLELAQLSPLPPQDSVSTNFTTSAKSSQKSVLSWKVEHSITQFKNQGTSEHFVVPTPPIRPPQACRQGSGPRAALSPASQLICRLVALTTSPHLRVSLSIKALNACGVLGGGGIRKPLVW